VDQTLEAKMIIILADRMEVQVQEVKGARDSSSENSFFVIILWTKSNFR
jgi:hypothetical protein